MLPGRSVTADVCIAYSAKSDESVQYAGGQDSGGMCQELNCGQHKSRNPLRSDFYWYGNVKFWVQEFGRRMLFIPGFSR